MGFYHQPPHLRCKHGLLMSGRCRECDEEREAAWEAQRRSVNDPALAIQDAIARRQRWFDVCSFCTAGTSPDLVRHVRHDPECVWLLTMQEAQIQYGLHRIASEGKTMTAVKRNIRLLVCGGRDYSDTETFEDTMRVFAEAYEILTVIHGGASGADAMADRWAQTRAIVTHRFPALWGKYGRSAGPRRNSLMLSEGRPDMVLAFPGGRGTADMVRQARERGIEVQEIEASPTPSDAQEPNP